MWKNFCNALGVTVFLMASCILIYPHPAFAIPPLSDSDAKRIVEEGRGQGYIWGIPNVPIKTSNNVLKNLEKIGIVKLSNSNKGSGWIDVDITEKGKKASSGKNEKGFYLIKSADIKVTKIVKNSEYKTPLANPDEELRIVMGVYNFTPTQIGKEFYLVNGDVLESSYKFRALLKYEPFKEKYVYVTSDYGKLNKENFESNNIENYNFPLGYKKY